MDHSVYIPDTHRTQALFRHGEKEGRRGGCGWIEADKGQRWRGRAERREGAREKGGKAGDDLDPWS